MDLKKLFRIGSIPVVIASLCCLSPIILVLFGIGTVGFASSLADTLYGEYKWAFRLAGIAAMAVALVLYFRRERNICTLDQVKRRRNEIVNIIALAGIFGILGYLFFLYVVVHYLGVWLSLWR